MHQQITSTTTPLNYQQSANSLMLAQHQAPSTTMSPLNSDMLFSTSASLLASMTEQQVSTLASLLQAQDRLLFDQNQEASSINNNISTISNFNNNALNTHHKLISEEDELKLLNFPSIREDLSTAIPLTVIFALLLVTGCIGNICTAIVIARPKNKYMHTATNFYLFSLAMSDLLFLVLGLPQEMYTLWQRYPYAFGESFCIARGYLSEASTYASILTISAFTIERYVAICHPLWAHTMSQLPRAITSIVIIWLVAAVCAIPPAAELGIITQKGPITNRTLEQSAQCATKRTLYENMFVVSAIVFFIVPMIIVTVLYVLIAIELRRSSKMNSAISKQTSSHLYSQQSTTSQQQAQYGPTALVSNTIKQANNCCCSSKAPFTTTHHGQHHHHQHQHQKRTSMSMNSTTKPIAQVALLQNKQLVHAQSQQLTRVDNEDLAPPNCVAHEQQATKNLLKTTTTRNDNLMAELMSQRPQSAIGNERICTPVGALVATLRSSANTPPADEDGRDEREAERVATAATTTLERESFLQHNNTTTTKQATVNKLLYKRLFDKFCSFNNNTSTSVQCNAQVANNKSLLEQGDAHSPQLSYHESLRNHHSTPPINCLRRVVQHQSIDNMSLPQHKLCCSHSFYAAASREHQPASSWSHLACQNAKLLHHSSNPNQPNHHHHHNSFKTSPTPNHHHCHQHQFQNSSFNKHSHNHMNLIGANQRQQQHMRRSNAASSKKSVIRMLVAVVVSFFICWVPFHAQRLLASYLSKDENQNQLLLDIYLKLTYISGVMYYLSSTINPLLYQLMSAKFRLAFKETFKCSLFTCAIFRRSSSLATNAPCQHSPTNSIRDNANSTLARTPDAALQQQRQQHAAHHTTQQHQASCFMQHCGSCQPCCTGACCTCCCCLCGMHVTCQQVPVTPLARLRGRLNASLGSLLRNIGGGSRDTCQPNNNALMPSSNCFAGLTLSEKRKLLTLNGNSGKACESPLLHAERALSCSGAATPLLNANKHSVSQQHLAPQSMQANFPAHHTMLKFIRSPTPSMCGVVQMNQMASLTRLSSREDDDTGESAQDDDDHSDRDEEAAVQMAGADETTSDKRLIEMDALIKPTLVNCCSSKAPLNACDDDDDDNNLIITSVESGQSSASMSPDQLGTSSTNNGCGYQTTATVHTTTATTTATTATTTSSSSTSSLNTSLINPRTTNKRRTNSTKSHTRSEVMKSNNKSTKQQVSLSKSAQCNGNTLAKFKQENGSINLHKQRRSSLQQKGLESQQRVDIVQKLSMQNDDNQCSRRRKSSSENPLIGRHLSSSSSEIRMSDATSEQQHCGGKKLSISTTTTSVLIDDLDVAFSPSNSTSSNQAHGNENSNNNSNNNNNADTFIIFSSLSTEHPKHNDVNDKLNEAESTTVINMQAIRSDLL